MPKNHESYLKDVMSGRIRDDTTLYALKVDHEQIPACKKVKQACKRHLLNLARQEEPEFPFKFDLERADRPVRFASKLKHWEGSFAGKFFEPMLWQKFILGSVFGWIRKDNGRRRYRYAYIEIPRKNGKSFLAAVVALYMLVADKEDGAQVYSAATKKEQAKIVWECASNIAEKSGIKQITKHWLSLRVKSTNSVFKPMAAEARKEDGLNPHCAVCDELHEWPSRDLWDVIEDAFGARTQPLLFAITTAGYNQEGICWQQHTHVVNILDSVVNNGLYQDETYFGFIADLDEDLLDPKKGGHPLNWTEPKFWAQANPCLGEAKQEDYILDQVNKARLMPSKENAVKNKQFNIWTQAETKWLDMMKWDECNALEVDAKRLERLKCYSGLDLSSTNDITAHVLAFPPNGVYDEWSVLTHFYLPKDNLHKRSKQDRVIYEDWVRQGWITLTPGDLIDLDFVFTDALRLKGRYNIVSCGFDPWKAVEIATKLESEGLKMVQMRQGHQTLGPPSRFLELGVLKTQFRFNRNPVLRWMAGNTAGLRDSNDNVRPDKSDHNKRIDGVVALVMALGQGIVDAPARKSKYETQGLLVVGRK